MTRYRRRRSTLATLEKGWNVLEKTFEQEVMDKYLTEENIAIAKVQARKTSRTVLEGVNKALIASVAYTDKNLCRSSDFSVHTQALPYPSSVCAEDIDDQRCLPKNNTYSESLNKEIKKKYRETKNEAEEEEYTDIEEDEETTIRRDEIRQTFKEFDEEKYHNLKKSNSMETTKKTSRERKLEAATKEMRKELKAACSKFVKMEEQKAATAEKHKTKLKSVLTEMVQNEKKFKKEKLAFESETETLRHSVSKIEKKLIHERKRSEEAMKQLKSKEEEVLSLKGVIKELEGVNLEIKKKQEIENMTDKVRNERVNLEVENLQKKCLNQAEEIAKLRAELESERNAAFARNKREAERAKSAQEYTLSKAPVTPLKVLHPVERGQSFENEHRVLGSAQLNDGGFRDDLSSIDRYDSPRPSDVSERDSFSQNLGHINEDGFNEDPMPMMKSKKNVVTPEKNTFLQEGDTFSGCFSQFSEDDFSGVSGAYTALENEDSPQKVSAPTINTTATTAWSDDHSDDNTESGSTWVSF